MPFPHHLSLLKTGKPCRSASIIIAAAAILGLLASCSPSTIEDVPPKEILTSTGTFSKSGKVEAPNDWWISFNDPQLNQLVETSLENNPGLAQAWARLRMAEASQRIAGAANAPNLTLAGSAQRRFVNALGPSSSIETTSGSTSFSTSYELDLWGRVRSEKDAAIYETRATEQDLQTAAISLVAQVTDTWFMLEEKTAQRSLLEAQYKNARQTLELMQTRFESGSLTGTDLLQQQQSAEARNAALILNQSEIEVAEHMLAILLGRDPAHASFAAGEDLPNLPELPDLGIPAVVLNQRPDVQAALLRVRGADASVAASIANRFPKITIGGSLTSNFGSPVNLFEDWVKTLLANLNLPILDGGSKKAETDRRQAQLTAAILSYQQAFLNAMKEVEDAVAQERQQVLYIASLKAQIKLSEQVYEQTLNRFQNGNRTYLQVLTAQDSLHSLNRNLLTAHRTLLTYRINLYRAIGGPVDLPESVIFETFSETRL